MHDHVHALSQPLTALQCRLEIGRMLGDPASLLEAVEGGLAETRRIFAAVAQMRLGLRGPEETMQSPPVDLAVGEAS